MDRDFDERIREYAKKEQGYVPVKTKRAINQTLNEIERQKKISSKSYFRLKVVIGMLCVMVLGGNVLASTKIGNTLIDGVKSFFLKKDGAKYQGDVEALEGLEQYIGRTVEGNEKKVKLESIALDDNFMNIFYSIRSDEKIIHEGEMGDVASLYAPFLEIKIDDTPWKYMNNGQDQDAYLEDEKTLKVMERIDVAHLKLPKKFKLDIVLKDRDDPNKNWRFDGISVQKVDMPTRNIDVNQQFLVNAHTFNHKGKETFELNIDKVILSPLASQVIITETHVQENQPFNALIFYDQDDHPLQIVTQSVGGTRTSEGKTSTNGFEFIPTPNLKRIKIVPFTSFKGEDEVEKGTTYFDIKQSYQEQYPTEIKIDINELPKKIKRGPLITYEFLDASIEEDRMVVRIKIDGVVRDELMKTEVYPLDENEEWLVHSGIRSISVDRKTGIYTIRLDHTTRRNERVDLRKTKYLTLDDGGYMIPEQLLWNQAIEVDVQS